MPLTYPNHPVQAPEEPAPFDFSDWSAHQLVRVEHALCSWLPQPSGAVPWVAGVLAAPCEADVLAQAMRYAVLGGGKRLRPLLLLAACETVNANPRAALRAACAVELIHAYSLVHDDLPCMDNDTLRRGQPTVHVKFGQAQALLVGDALQALAFELLTPADSAPDAFDAATQARLCSALARAAGYQGMAAGQAIDLASVGLRLTTEQLHSMHRLKTGALLQASVLMGACCSAAPPPVHAALADYGAAVGLAFQVIDDVLDVTASSAALGKTAGKDAAQDKPTFVSLMGLEAAKSYAQQLHARALASLHTLSDYGLNNTQALHALAGLLVNRQH